MATSQIAESLTIEERSVLLILMAEGGQTDADTLASVLGDPIPDQVYQRLERAGLIDITKLTTTHRRRYGCALTEDGWYWCSQEVTKPGPRPSEAEPFAGVLYLVLNMIERHLESTGQGVSEFFTAARTTAQADL